MGSLNDTKVERLRATIGDDTFAGRFELIREAGAGGMGRVFEAIERSGGRRIALKVLTGRTGDDHARFAAEAEILEGLHHAAIVPYVGHGVTSTGDPYLAMQWLDGETLGVCMRRDRLAIGDATMIAQRIAKALAHAHSAGVIHRDVKPSNILLVDGDPSRATLIDFGVAKAAPRDLTLTGQVVGTPAYMAPEQALGRAIDGRADLFALGCVLHEMLTGQRLFDGEHVIEVLGRVLLHDAKTLAVPPRLAHLVKALIAKDPEQRPSDAARVAAELAAIHVAILSGDRRALATPKQRDPRMRYVLLGICAVGGAIAVGYLYNRSGDADEPQDEVTAPTAAKAPLPPLDGTYYGSEERRTVMRVPPPGGTKRSIDKIRVTIVEVEGVMRIRFGGDINHKGADCELFARRSGTHATPIALYCANPIDEVKVGPPRGNIDFAVAPDGALGVSMTIHHDVTGTGGKDGLSIHVEYEIIRILSATRMSKPPF